MLAPAQFRRVSLALATPANGTRSAARTRTRTGPPLHAPPTSLTQASCMLAPRRPNRRPSFPSQAERSKPSQSRRCT